MRLAATRTTTNQGTAEQTAGVLLIDGLPVFIGGLAIHFI